MHTRLLYHTMNIVHKTSILYNKKNFFIVKYIEIFLYQVFQQKLFNWHLYVVTTFLTDMSYQPVSYPHLLQQLQAFTMLMENSSAIKKRYQLLELRLVSMILNNACINFIDQFLCVIMGKKIDSTILIKTLLNHPNCGSLPIEGFVDTLHVFREVLPNMNTYKL